MPDDIHQEARILIIDDEEMAADVLCRILEADGFQHVERILDPRQAVAKFRNLKPDLVILDWMMPKVSGGKVLQQLRAEIAASDYLPILVVTALPHIETKQEALGRGATDFLTKPYDPSEIVLRVGNLLATRFLHLELKQQNQQLEKWVAERTAELTKANAALAQQSRQREEVAQEALRETEEWEQSFDAVPDYICILDLEGKILRANRTMRERFEPIHGPLIGLDYRVCYCGTATPDPQPPCAEVFVKNRPIVWEGTLSTMEGWYWIAAYPLTEEGVPWGAISVVRDITARKEAEEGLREAQEEVEARVQERTEDLTLANAALSVAQVVRDHALTKLRASEEKLNLALDGGDLGTWDFDLVEQTIEVSPRLEQMFGLAVRSGSAFEDFMGAVHPEDRDRLRAELDRTIETGVPYEIEHRLVWPDGTVHWIAARAKARCDHDGKVTHITGTAHDSTPQKKAEEKLRATEARYSAVVANVPGVVYRVVRRPDRSVVSHFVSEGCHELFGIGMESFDGEADQFGDMVHPEDRDNYLRSREAVLASGDDFNWEGRVVRADGETKWIAITARSRQQGDGNTEWDGVLIDVTKRRQAEEALQESDARYQRIAANAPGMVYQFIQRDDGSMEFPFVSDGARKIFGLEPAEIEADAQILISRIHPADLGGFAASVEKSRRSGQDWNWEGRFTGPSGEEFWISGSSRPVAQEGGDVTWDGLLIDITERKRAEALLATTEARYRQIVETAQEGIWVIDPWGRTTFANPKMAEMLGITAAEMNGRSMYDFMDAEARTIAEENMKRRGEGIAEQHEFRFRRSDGASLWTLMVTNPLPAAGSGFGGALAMVTDITERKRSEEQLQEAARENTQLASAIANLTSGVTITDPSLPDHPVIFANAAFYALTGYSPAEVLGRNCRFLQGRETDPATVQEIRDAIAARRTYQGDVLNYRKDGSTFWNELTITPVFDRTGALLNFVGLQSDITARRETALALQRTKAEAERANAAKSEFLSRMSHELRTPLNAILGFAQLAQLDARSEDEQENVEQILKGGQHLLQLINEVLDISRIEAGQMPLTIEPISLETSLSIALSLVRPLAAARQVSLGDFACDGYVLADEQRLQQVLLNLLSNAIKYNKEGGSVTLACHETTRETLRVEVSDTGIGISEGDCTKLFQPFERLEPSASKVEGVGLGLAICQRLIGLMNGTLTVESTLGQGSTFSIELPVAAEFIKAGADLPVSQDRSETPSSGPTRTLLYIEDNVSNLKLVERIVAKQPGLKMIAAQQGSLGLELARQHQPDVILLDLHLPDMNGDQVLVWLRSEPRTADIPVVMISADAIGGEIERLKELGAAAYITKPFAVPKLLQVLDEALASFSVQKVPL